MPRDIVCRLVPWSTNQDIDDELGSSIVRLPAVVAVLGLAGSGKSETTRLLATRYDYRTVYLGGVIIELVRAAGLEVTPGNERLVRERLREEEGMEAVARRTLPAISAALGAGHRVAIDGIYGFSELTLITEEVADPIVTIAVHAARAVRLTRLASRAERPLSAEEVDARDVREIEKLGKAKPIVLADHHIVNNGTSIEVLAHSLSDVLARAGQEVS